MKTYKELKEMDEEDLDEYLEDLDEDEQEEQFYSLLKELANDDNYGSKVYEGSGYYFALGEEDVYEVTAEAGYSPRGGNYIDVFTGLNSETREAIKKITDKLDEDELTDLFEEISEQYGEDFDDDDVLEYFDDAEEEDGEKLYKKLMKAVAKSDGAFESAADFAEKFKMRDLEEGTIYYEWEGEYIDLMENLYEVGQGRGYLEDDSDEEWIRTLLDLDNLIVTV